MKDEDKPCKNSNRRIGPNGYHSMDIKSTGYSSEHRFVYGKHHKVHLTSKDIIMHTCDNKWCVEITHLVLGTQKDNIRDAMSKGRLKMPPRKTTLTKQHVRRIRKLWALGKYTQADLAEEYDVSRYTIQDILYRKTWKEV